jgi:hypothetical protein
MPEFSKTAYKKPLLETAKEKQEVKKISHIPTPFSTKGIYMSQCIAATPTLRSKLIQLVNETELNAIVVDVKDYSGGLAFDNGAEIFKDKLSKECFVNDMEALVEELHRNGIYTIARITVFQDPLMSKQKPEIAIKKNSDKAVVWRDRKGISFIDPGSREMWDYIRAVAVASYEIGFDEVNFDYVRYPSDGDMEDIYFPLSHDVVDSDPEWGKSYVMKSFFSYIGNEMKKRGIPSSVDIFGMTTTNSDDLNIGQVLEDVVPYFDYVSPMVYPSHYPPNFIGISNPAAKPYEVIRYSMGEAFRRASTTAWKFRPWLQDFDLGATYTAQMVKDQIQATYDSGFNSWFLWDASNKYTKEALLPEN